MQNDAEYIKTLELAVRLLLSRIGNQVIFNDDEVIEHRNDLILFERYETFDGASHLIKKVSS